MNDGRRALSWWRYICMGTVLEVWQLQTQALRAAGAASQPSGQNESQLSIVDTTSRANQLGGAVTQIQPQNEDKATLEAAMAAGETSGQSTKPRKVVSSAARKRVATPETEGTDNEVDEEPAPLIKEADPEFERLLDEEDAIEASTREQSETPNFRAND